MANTKYKIERTNRFKKDYKKIKTKNFFDEREFIRVVTLLANDEILPEKYCNHLLEPKNKGIWECHIKPDWLLMYTKSKDLLVLTLTRTGSHSDLFI